MHRATMVDKSVKQRAREWHPSTTGPRMPTVTDRLRILCLGMCDRRFRTLSRAPNGVSSEHSCSDRIFLRTLLFAGHGGWGGGTSSLTWVERRVTVVGRLDRTRKSRAQSSEARHHHKVPQAPRGVASPHLPIPPCYGGRPRGLLIAGQTWPRFVEGRVTFPARESVGEGTTLEPSSATWGHRIQWHSILCDPTLHHTKQSRLDTGTQRVEQGASLGNWNNSSCILHATQGVKMHLEWANNTCFGFMCGPRLRLGKHNIGPLSVPHRPFSGHCGGYRDTTVLVYGCKTAFIYNINLGGPRSVLENLNFEPFPFPIKLSCGTTD